MRLLLRQQQEECGEEDGDGASVERAGMKQTAVSLRLNPPSQKQEEVNGIVWFSPLRYCCAFLFTLSLFYSCFGNWFVPDLLIELRERWNAN